MTIPTLEADEASTGSSPSDPRRTATPPPRRIKDPAGDRAFMIVNYCVLAFFAISVLYPLIYVISSSFSSGTAISNGDVKLWPIEPNVEAYKTIFSYDFILKGFLNSTIYAVAGALLGTVLTVLASYPLSRTDLPFRRPLLFMILVPTLFSAGIIPNYVVVAKLGLLDTRWAIILPAAMSVFNVIITRTFYQLNVPNELLEAAKIDGASDWRFFRSIALPLSKPIIAVNLLFYGIAQWNGWFPAMLYLTNQDLIPLQLVLRQILTLASVNPADMSSVDASQLMENRELFNKLRYAVIVVAMVPPLIAYPFVQRHFVKGALIGSIK